MAKDITASAAISETKPASVQPADKKYMVTFKYNRSFDLYVGQKFFHFKPNESRDDFTESDMQHPDFIQQQEYFSVREI